MNKLISLTNSRFKKLISEHISLDEIFLLQLAAESANLEDFKERKITILISGLKRKGFLDEEGCITALGRDMYTSILEDREELVLGRIQNNNEDFERFWLSYPGNDTVKVDGKIIFKGTRSLRKNKDTCKGLFLKILAEGKYSASDLIKAVQYEVQGKVEKSIKTRENKLSFQNQCEVWLRQRVFEGFIEDALQAELKPIKKTTNFDTIA